MVKGTVPALATFVTPIYQLWNLSWSFKSNLNWDVGNFVDFRGDLVHARVPLAGDVGVLDQENRQEGDGAVELVDGRSWILRVVPEQVNEELTPMFDAVLLNDGAEFSHLIFRPHAEVRVLEGRVRELAVSCRRGRIRSVGGWRSGSRACVRDRSDR